MSTHSNLKASALKRIGTDAPGTVWTAGDFLDLGSRDAIDKLFQRLAAAGTLRRIDRGLYDQPQPNNITKNPNPPEPRKVIEAIARRDQMRILVDGMTAANDLGLSNAVPAKIVVHSDTQPRKLKLGELEIDFRPTAASKLFWAGRPAMRIVQALHWLRDASTDAEEDQSVRSKVEQLLWREPDGALLRDDLRNGMPALPAWMQEYLRPLLSEPGAK